MLDELAELGLGLARDLQRRALEAEAPAEATASLADAFQRVARSVRQSLALQARLAREALKDAVEDRPSAPPRTSRRRPAPPGGAAPGRREHGLH